MTDNTKTATRDAIVKCIRDAADRAFEAGRENDTHFRFGDIIAEADKALAAHDAAPAGPEVMVPLRPEGINPAEIVDAAYRKGLADGHAAPAEVGELEAVARKYLGIIDWDETDRAIRLAHGCVESHYEEEMEETWGPISHMATACKEISAILSRLQQGEGEERRRPKQVPAYDVWKALKVLQSGGSPEARVAEVSKMLEGTLSRLQGEGR